MSAIDKAAAENGVPPTGVMSQTEATACFEAGKAALSAVSPRTPKGRLRDLEKVTWSTVIRCLRAPRKKASTEGANERKNDHEDDSESAQPIASNELSRNYVTFAHPDGIHRRVPPNYRFADTKLLPMYIQWHCGDVTVYNGEEHRVSPIKLWELIDIQEITDDNKRHMKISLSSIRRLMGFIDKVAAENGFPPKADMTQEEVTECFEASRAVLHSVTPKTSTGKERNPENISWEYVGRLLQISRLKYNPGETSES